MQVCLAGMQSATQILEFYLLKSEQSSIWKIFKHATFFFILECYIIVASTVFKTAPWHAVQRELQFVGPKSNWNVVNCWIDFVTVNGRYSSDTVDLSSVEIVVSSTGCKGLLLELTKCNRGLIDSWALICFVALTVYFRNVFFYFFFGIFCSPFNDESHFVASANYSL